EGGGVLSPQREPELSADDRALHLADAGDDYPLLRRLVPDAGDRSAALSGVHLLHLQFLPSFTKGIVPTPLATHVPLPSLSHGAGHRAYTHQYARGHRGPAGREVAFQSHSQISRAVQGGPGAGTEISPASRAGSLAGTAGGHVFRDDVHLCVLERQLLDHPIPPAVCAGILVHGADVSAARQI